MPGQRDNARNFPGRRWLNLSLRTAHLADIVLFGAALLSAGCSAAHGKSTEWTRIHRN